MLSLTEHSTVTALCSSYLRGYRYATGRARVGKDDDGGVPFRRRYVAVVVGRDE